MSAHRVTTTADLPWYLEADALAIIAGIASKPEVGHIGGRLGIDRFGNSPVRDSDLRPVYVGAEVAALQRYWTLRFKAIDAIVPWPEARMNAVLMCATEQDVLAALFGNPAGYPAFAETEAKWAGIREAINAALVEPIGEAA